MPQKSLGHEVNELTSSRLLKLEMENQSLLKTVEELQNTVGSVEGSNSKILKMEKENHRLSKKVSISVHIIDKVCSTACCSDCRTFSFIKVCFRKLSLCGSFQVKFGLVGIVLSCSFWQIWNKKSKPYPRNSFPVFQKAIGSWREGVNVEIWQACS